MTDIYEEMREQENQEFLVGVTERANSFWGNYVEIFIQHKDHSFKRFEIHSREQLQRLIDELSAIDADTFTY